MTSAPFAKTLVYADSRQAELRVYLGDPDVPIDTNHLERALRVIPMGRKAWLFCWTEVGARHVGIIQSLLTTCRLQGVGNRSVRTAIDQSRTDLIAAERQRTTPSSAAA